MPPSFYFMYQFLVFLISWGLVGASEVSSSFRGAEELSHRLQELRQDLTLPIAHQAELLGRLMKNQEDIVESFVSLEYRIQDMISGQAFVPGNQNQPVPSQRDAWSFEGSVGDISRPAEIPVRIEVVFIGFSANAVDVIDDHWLQKLNRSVHTPWARNHEAGDRKAPAIRYTFNPVQVSIHVEEAVKSLLSSRLRASSIPGRHYINAVEVEAHLVDLLSSLRPAEKDGFASIPAALTIFMINVPLHKDGREVTNYAYSSGFSDDDLLRLAAHSGVRKAAEDIVQRTKAKLLSRVDLEASQPSLSDTFSVMAPRRIFEDLGGPPLPDLNASTLGVQRDAVISSRAWALATTKALQSESGTFEERILTLLLAKHSESTQAFAHQVAIAKSITSATEAAKNAHDFETLCSFHSWFSDRRMAWLDLRSSQDPTVEASHGRVTNENTATTSLSHKLSSQLADALEGGTSATNRDHISLLHHRLAMLIQQSNCMKEEGMEGEGYDLGRDEDDWVYRLDDMSHMIVRGFFRGYHSQTCAEILLRRNFLRAFIAAEYKLDRQINEIHESGVSKDSYVFVEIQKFRNRLEREVIRLASIDERLGGFWDAILADFSDITALNSYVGSVVHHIVELAEQATLTTRGEEAKDVSSMLSDSEIEFLFAEEFVEDESGESRALSFHQYLELHMPDYSRTARNQALHHSITAASTPPSANHSKTQASLSRSMHGSGLLFPGKIDVVVYVIPLHETYKPAGDKGIDMAALLTELQALRLPNQRLQVTAQTLSIKTQQDIARGLIACRRMHRQGSTFSSTASPAAFYLSAECMWSHIRHEDDAATIKAGDIHMPIFLFSVDSELPLYIEHEGLVAVSMGSGVIAVQNQQRHVQSNYFCAGKGVVFNGRNPLAQILEVVATALVGASSANDKNYQLFGSSRSEFSGRSPLISGSLGSNPSFGESDLENAYRAKVLQSLEVGRWLLEQKYAAARALLCGLRGRRCLETWGLSYALPARVKELYMRALHATIQMRWSEAARLANALLFDARALRASDFDLANVEVLLAKSMETKRRRRKRKATGDDSPSTLGVEPQGTEDGVFVWIVRLVAFLCSAGVGFISCRYLYISSRK